MFKFLPWSSILSSVDFGAAFQSAGECVRRPDSNPGSTRRRQLVSMQFEITTLCQSVYEYMFVYVHVYICVLLCAFLKRNTGAGFSIRDSKFSMRIGALYYGDVIMSAMASQITSLTIVCTIVYLGANRRKQQSSPANSPHKGPVTRKRFAFDEVIMDYIRVI